MQTTADTRALFNHDAMTQAQLRVEAALAQVQAEIGIIPVAAAQEIERRAQIDQIDRAALAAEAARTQSPVLALSRILARACEGEAGGFVHYGATTQNVVQTGRLLQVRKAHDVLRSVLAELLSAFADKAEHHANTPMAGRTQGQHALPITFGFKVAGWTEEFLRHVERLGEIAPRLFRLRFGGAAGTGVSWGDKAEAVIDGLGERLGLPPVAVPARSATDAFAEYVLALGLLANSATRVANDLLDLMSEEIKEVREGLDEGVVGSSTLPQKVNPKRTMRILVLAGKMRALLPLALEGMQQRHEGHLAADHAMNEAVDAACPLTVEIVEQLAVLIRDLGVNEHRMAANLERSGGAICAESAMMALAAELGRGRAHDIVHAATAEATARDEPLRDALWRVGDVRAVLSSSALSTLLSPTANLGLSVQLADRMAVTARTAADRLRKAP